MTEHDSGTWPLLGDARDARAASGGRAGVRVSFIGTTAAVNGPRARS
ncbi:hypothetical protein [Streptomyces sp. DSM 40750]|nr:hypothetical protein [Streptomyces sp. DSM 40750]UUU23625.1 hypothetical protein JIX55_27060 [Streptomyces sp. DSM 40750]